MKIAHLILAHTDLSHINRLARELSVFSDVFIHIDKKTEADFFYSDLKNVPHVFFTNKRLHVEWGG